jgi:GcrA cell cycle regulator
MAIPPPIIEEIVALAAAGLSRTLIADRIGHGITRSAVSGLLARRGIKTAKAPRISKPRRSTRPPVRRVRAPVERRFRRGDESGQVAHTIRPPASLLELADDGCHWPVSGKGLATLFCNHGRAGSGHPSYCQRHAMRAIKSEAEAKAGAVEASRLRQRRDFWFGAALTPPCA